MGGVDTVYVGHRPCAARTAADESMPIVDSWYSGNTILVRNKYLRLSTTTQTREAKFAVPHRLVRRTAGIIALGEQKWTSPRMTYLDCLDGQAARLGIRFLDSTPEGTRATASGPFQVAKSSGQWDGSWNLDQLDQEEAFQCLR